MLKIEKISIRKFEKEGSKIVAFVNATVNDITINSMSLVEGSDGKFVSMPSQKGKDGKYRAYVYMSKEHYQELTDAVVNKFNNPEQEEQKETPENEMPF